MLEKKQYLFKKPFRKNILSSLGKTILKEEKHSIAVEVIGTQKSWESLNMTIPKDNAVLMTDKGCILQVMAHVRV